MFNMMVLLCPKFPQVGAEKNLLVKDHTHTFVNKGGEIGGMINMLKK